MNRLKSYKSRILLLAKSFYKYRSQQQQLASSSLRTYPTPGEVSLQYLRTIRTQCSNLWKLNNFSLYKKRCAATIKPKSLLMILASLQFILFYVQKMIYINLWPEFQKDCFLRWHVHFIDEEDIVTYEDFDCGFTFYPKTPAKIRQINQKRNYISRSCEKSKCIPSNDRHNCFLDEQHNSKIFPNPYNLRDIVPAAPLPLNLWKDRYSMSNQYPQPTTQQPRTDSYPVFSSLRRMDSQRKRLRISFAFFQRNYLSDGRVNQTVATVEELSTLWKPGAMDGVPPLVKNCNCIYL